MKIAGKICPFCQTVLNENDHAFTCSACGAPHHADCWNENDGCTTYGCQGRPLDSKLAPEPDMQISNDQAVICAKCGSKVSKYSKFCFACGSKIGESTNSHSEINDFLYGSASARTTAVRSPNIENENYTQYHSSHQQYVSPEFIINDETNTANAPADTQNINQSYTNNMYFEYIKRNWQYYEHSFEVIDGGKHKFNGAAFLFGIYWLFYRKMIGYGFAFAGIQVLLSIITTNLPFLRIITLLTTLTLFSFFANNLYKNHIDKKILTLIDAYHDENQTRAVLSAENDVSVGLCIGLGFAIFIAGWIIGYLQYYN